MKRRTSRRRRSARRTSLRRNPPISFSPETVALAHKVYGVKKNGRRGSSLSRGIAASRLRRNSAAKKHYMVSAQGGMIRCPQTLAGAKAVARKYGGDVIAVTKVGGRVESSETVYRAPMLRKKAAWVLSIGGPASQLRKNSRRLVSLFKNKQGRYASKWGSIFGKKTKKRRTLRKHTSARRRPSRASVRRTSRRLGGMFGMPARFKSTLRKPRRKSRRKTSKRRSSAPRGCWRIVVRGRTVPKRFRSSSSLRAYANKKYGRGYKYAWVAR